MTLNDIDEDRFIKEVMDRVLSGKDISFEDAERLIYSNDVHSLAHCSNTITRRFNGDVVDVETLINAKT